MFVDLQMTKYVYNQQKKSSICSETCSDLTQPCIKRFSFTQCKYWNNFKYYVKYWENSERKISCFFNLRSAAFTMTIFFTLVIVPQSISG